MAVDAVAVAVAEVDQEEAGVVFLPAEVEVEAAGEAPKVTNLVHYSEKSTGTMSHLPHSRKTSTFPIRTCKTEV